MQFDGVERTGVDRPECCVDPLALGVAPPTVVDAATSAEVGIITVGTDCVPPCHGVIERAGGHAELVAERCQSRRMHDPRWHRALTTEPSGQAVLRRVQLVEQQPRRHVRVLEGRRVHLVERGAEGVVVDRLVGEPPARTVDDDRPGRVRSRLTSQASTGRRRRKHEPQGVPPVEQRRPVVLRSSAACSTWNVHGPRARTFAFAVSAPCLARPFARRFEDILTSARSHVGSRCDFPGARPSVDSGRNPRQRIRGVRSAWPPMRAYLWRASAGHRERGARRQHIL